MSKGHPDKVADFIGITVNLCKDKPDATNTIIDESLASMLSFLDDECTAFGVRTIRSVTVSEAKDQQGKRKGVKLLVIRATNIDGVDVVRFQEADRPSVALANWFLQCAVGEFGWREDKKRDPSKRPASIFDAVGGTEE